MDAVILCAGSGTRLYPITENRPKPMIPIAGKPILEHIIEKIENHVEKIYLVVGFEKEKIIDYFYGNEKIEFIVQEKQLGTGHAVLMAKNYIKGDFLVLNGDVIFESDILEFLNYENAVGLSKVDNPENFGVIELGYDNKVINLLEKPNEDEIKSKFTSNLINAGIYKLENFVFEILENLLPSERGEIELTDALKKLIESSKLYGIELNGYWNDIGRPWDVLSANNYFLKNIMPKISGNIENNVTITGNVIIEEGVTVKSNSVIEGPVIIKSGAFIGPLAYIRPNTVLMEDTFVGNSSEIKGSIIMKNTKIPHLSYVGDSIIGSDCNFGCNTITANLRFDDEPVTLNIKGTKVKSVRKFGAVIGDNVKTGIQVSLMPGVKVGSNSIIGANCLVDKDIEKESFVYKKDELIIKKRN
ncbi:Nucleotidyl transferase [Methanococcus vannielii SB]|jgi:bifunctional UDP-N-acetylglucosamine pyrophosphorylase/glucosamine-1-phosphate N-acetyltransferase|uniref:Bifunctional protein GlmU n=1 Tax=Methanococcus vannielii (strain ATCC 35089 / DSM 1224 / JCM 13029 / OCM 148 / SB) TaxID=406327 RepID=GLMU_METVS|nr:bifunctional sugar-1-phosphate nucleotidylyltransferase/acetyltransferase [Methanococcus vannielii]A6UP85.1 RecName: Full=Bifunctional protein GlmU; Includes: RecName: Full=UDP-N-acetylglucosamine pyrophosphorylase; AltName: Full=N-acetylglucosamine-1-phosphate uridyltransferase; Includes: RecName: Full=Glucosamine-1-phosphate N-acetyltransferase [Methanococcus vannielii SB]ABR54307.1 Nucleotidyl transferase [Methanococcus vannielii SB]